MKNKIAIQMDDIKSIDFDFDSSVVSRAPPLRVRAISVPDGSMGVVDLLLHLSSVPTVPAPRVRAGAQRDLRLWRRLCAFLQTPRGGLLRHASWILSPYGLP